MALFRALETRRPPKGRLFSDPYAHIFLDNGLKTAVWLSKIPGIRKVEESIIRSKIPGALSSGIARTKYIDDLLETTVGNGIQQVIILGAGFDTRALRLSFLASVPVIEIDHPNTSRFKLLKLRRSQPAANISYHQIDFNYQSLDELGEQQHFDYTLPTTVIWEGVTNYLTAEAIDKTFSFLQLFASGSYVIFTYINRQILTDPSSYFGGEKLLEDVSGLEEKWTFGFWPDELPDYLQRYRFTLLEDMGADDYRRKYMPERNEPGYEFYRVAFAEKK